jgi:hypothetical protein
MKKLFLFAFAIAVAMNVSAQKMYFGGNLGYNMAATKWAIGTKVTDAGTSNLYGSMGQGIKPALRFGYMTESNFGAELGFGYTLGSKVTVLDQNTTTATSSNVVLQTAQAKFMNLSLQMVFRTELGLYSKFGLFLPAGGTTYVEFEQTVTATLPIPTTTHVLQSIEMKGRFTPGFCGSLGYAYALSDNLDIFLEGEYVGLKIYRKSSTLKKYTNNDVDKMSTLKTKDIETEFVDEVLKTDNTDVNVAKKSLTTATQYSSFGINLGVTFKF